MPDIAEWLVSKSSRFLDTHLTRRSFIARSTMVGTAVAASGCAVIAGPGAPYTYVTDCGGGSLCRDGYTEFCCVINGGVNQCPPGTAAAGWWRADGSIYCDSGTRFLIDCNQWPDGGPCRCAAGCGTRKVYCNHFRYGQCNTHVGGTGVIACRMVTCVPPYAIAELNCNSSGASDNATANHYADCAAYAGPPPPPPPVPVPSAPSLGTALATNTSDAAIVVRAAGGAVAYLDTGSAWSDLGNAATSKVELVARGGGLDAFVRQGDRTVAVNHFDGSTWSGWVSIGGSLFSDPAVATFGVSDTYVFGRSNDSSMAVARFDGSTWTPFNPLGGSFTSDPAAVEANGKIWVAARDGVSGYWVRWFDGTQWSPWGALGGDFASDPWLLEYQGSFFIFGRARDGTAYVRAFNDTAWTGWGALGGLFASEITATSDGTNLWVFGRSADGILYGRRWDSSGWSAWENLAAPTGGMTTDPEPVSDAGGVSVFSAAPDSALWTTRWDGTTWSSWTSLASPTGGVEPYNGYS